MVPDFLDFRTIESNVVLGTANALVADLCVTKKCNCRVYKEILGHHVLICSVICGTIQYAVLF